MTAEPVHDVPKNQPEAPEEGIALCMSGGGYRAMLFHLGTLWRLNEGGYLPRLERISSVSGGSITSALLAMNWSSLEFDASGVGKQFNSKVVEPIRAFARRTVDVSAVLRGLFLPGTVGNCVERTYRQNLFGEATLQNLPDHPRFVINATNLQSGVLWRFSKPYMGDYRVGLVSNPNTYLALAVAASSAFPPVLSPVTLKLQHEDFIPASGTDLQHKPFTTNVVLSDGGVYDNLGVETVLKRYTTVLVSDAGGLMTPEVDPKRDWMRQLLRVLNVIDNQVRSLRKRQIIDGFVRHQREGAYWGIRSDISEYQLSDSLPCPHDRTLLLAEIPTRLKKLDDHTQERLINWGYAVCDTAMRKHVDKNLTRPADFPYKDVRV